MAVDPFQAFADALDVEGGGTWAPVRSPRAVWSAWGRWECWEHCKIDRRPDGTVGPIPTGDWVAWDSATGALMGFPTRKQAEMLAVLQNENAPTRVVPFAARAEASSLNFDAVNDLVSAEMNRMAAAEQAPQLSP